MPRPSVLATRALLLLPEHVEHERQELGRDPLAGVGDDDLARVCLTCRA